MGRLLEINGAQTHLLIFRNSKEMKSSIKIILLVPAVVLTSVGAWAGLNSRVDTGSVSTIGSAKTSRTSTIVLYGSLVRFDAAYGINFFNLNWNTRTESLFDHFEVERSIDGTNFKKVGEIKALGLSSTEENYSFRDNIR